MSGGTRETPEHPTDRLTPAEVVVFAAAVMAAPLALGLLIASLYVAGSRFVLVLLALAVSPTAFVVVVGGLAGIAAFVTWAQHRWTRTEIAVGCTGVLTAVLAAAPTVLVGDLGTGVALGVVLVATCAAFGPLPVCFLVALRVSRAMRLGLADPTQPSWLRPAIEACAARATAVRAGGRRVVETEHQLADHLREELAARGELVRPELGRDAA